MALRSGYGLMKLGYWPLGLKRRTCARLAMACSAGLMSLGVVSSAAPHALAQTSSDAITVTPLWTRSFSCADTSATTCGVLRSSPTIATLEGQKAVVVGAQDGSVYALNLQTGQPLPGWPVNVGQPILSTPSVDPSTGNVFIGAGDKYGGGYFSFTQNARVRQL